MLNYVLYLIPYMLLSTCSCKNLLPHADNLQSFLTEKFLHINEELNINIAEHLITERDIHKSFKYLSYETTQISGWKSFHVLNLFNTSYFFNGSLYEIVPGELNFLINEAEDVDFHIGDDEIKFITTIPYNNKEYIVICLKRGISKVYLARNMREISLMQTIDNPNDIVDVKLFVNDEKLYLVTISNFDTPLSVILVYKWAGTYFDKIVETFSKKISFIFTFSTPNTKIVAVLQNSTRSLIYELKDNHLIKIQILQILNPYYVVKYEFNGKVYLGFFNRKLGLILYQWNDIEMVYLNTYNISEDTEKIHISYVNNIPILFIARKNEMVTYNLNEKLNFLENYLFDDSFLEIYEMKTVSYSNKYFLYFFGRTENDTIELNSMKFAVLSTETDSKVDGEDTLTSCLLNLEKILNKDEEQINMPLIEKPNYYENNSVTEASSILQQPNIIERFDVDLSKKLEEATDILNGIVANLAGLFRPNIGVFKGRINILGGLRTSTLKGDRIYVEKLNSVKWSPENWLSYDTKQTFIGNLKLDHVIIENLTMPNANLFDDVLLLNGNQKLYGPITFNSLEANDLYTTNINGIALMDLYFKGDFRKVTGTKKFDFLKCDNLTVDILNKRNTFDYLKYFTATENQKYNSSLVTIENLEVESVNGVHWNSFKDSIFRNGTTNKITGDLVIKHFQAGKLNVRSINNIDPENILTKGTNQNISARIDFARINSRKFVCPNINGVNFATDIITTLDENVTISGPVTFERIQILKNLHFNSTDPNNAKNNIFNYQQYEMQQNYKHVKIIGDVKVGNLTFLPNTGLILNGKEFNMVDIPNKYWLRNTPQIIPVPVKVLNGITAPSLVTSLLNGIEVNKYMINDFGEKLPGTYLFNNLTVIGNVTIDSDLEHSPNFISLNASSVKLSGSYEIFGKKTFRGNLFANKAEIELLDNINTAHALNIEAKAIPGKKQFERLIIKGNLTCNNSYITFLNDVELNNIYKQYLSGNRNAYLHSLRMKDITVKELKTTKLNNENLNKYILNLDNLRSIKQLKYVEINGDVTVNNLSDIIYLNDVNFNVIAEKIAGDPIMAGHIRFQDHVFIKNFKVSNINNVLLRDLTENIIYRNSKNNIKAKQYFKKIRTPSLQCGYINNYDMGDILNVKEKKSQTLMLRKTLRLKQARFLKSLSGKLPCDTQEIAKSIQNPPTRYWSTLTIRRNATIEDKKHIISSILANAIVIGKDNNITAPVTLSRVTAKNIYTKNQINGINIEKIYQDALLKSNSDQLINGSKTFAKLTAAGAVVVGDAKIPTVNKLWIQEIDKNIIPKDKIFNRVIKGHKTFANGLVTGQLNTNEISSISLENLVSVENLKRIPNAVFDKLHVLYNFDIVNVNGVNFTAFLEGRVLKNSMTKQVLSGIYYFDNVHILGEAWISTLNTINLDDVVFDIDIQNISSSKKFAEDLVVYGDVTIDRLNGINLTEKYETALLTNKEIEVENIVFKGITELNSISARNLNGIPIESIKAMVQSETPKFKANIVHDTINKIQDIIQTNMKIAEGLPTEYIYFDKYYDFDISIPNAISSQAIKTNGHAIIHVLSEEPGYTCGLPLQCKCLIQNTIQITPTLSIQPVPNKGNQRIYSFEDSMLVIHVITDSISYSMECRNMNTSSMEYTTLTWINKTTGRSFAYNKEIAVGYVDNAEFLSYTNHVYVILSKLYGTQEDNENSPYCIILRLDREKNLVEIIQKIPITIFGRIHIFNTSHGINLVLGNAYYASQKIPSSMVTGVYKFDLQKQKFSLIREILGVHCVSVTSAVLGIDNFVIMSQKTKAVIIWKYNHHHENYYFYQKFLFDSRVRSISSFHNEGFAKQGDALISLVTEQEHFYIYSYAYVEGWKLLSHGELEGLRLLSPFSLNKQIYLFAPLSRISSLLTQVKQGRD